MELKRNINVHNRFDVYVNSRWKGCAENIILNKMYDRLCTGASYFEYIFFGTGIGTPTSDRTSLFNHLGKKTAVTEEVIKAMPVSSWKRKIILNPEEYVGETISEVGIGYVNWQTALVTHAMLKDAEGQPITITKTDTDVVVIFATVYFTFSNANLDLTLQGLPDNNILLNYLTGNSFPSIDFDLKFSKSARNILGRMRADITDDISNRQRIVSTRFDILTGNGDVQCLTADGLFDLSLPSVGVYTGQNLQGVVIGSGDGNNAIFDIPSANVDPSSITIKKNGAADNSVGFERINTKCNFTYLPFSSENVDRYAVQIGFFNNSRDFIKRYQDITIHKYENGSYNPKAISISSEFPINSTLKYQTDTIRVKQDDMSFIFRADFNEMPNQGLCIMDFIDGEWVFRSDFTLGYDLLYADWDITPDFTTLIANDKQANVCRVYDIVDQTQLVERPAHPDMGSALYKISNDGLTIVGIVGTAPIVFTWDGASWSRENVEPSTRRVGNVRLFDISADGVTIACGSDPTGHVFFYKKGDDGIYRHHSEIPIAIYSDSNYKKNIVLSNDGTMVVLNATGVTNRPYLRVFYLRTDGWYEKKDVEEYYNVSAGQIVMHRDAELVAAFRYLDSWVVEPFIFDYSKRETEVTFTTPPEQDALITADYMVEGLHKTDQYVVDVGCTIKFNEGV